MNLDQQKHTLLISLKIALADLNVIATHGMFFIYVYILKCSRKCCNKYLRTLKFPQGRPRFDLKHKEIERTVFNMQKYCPVFSEGLNVSFLKAVTTR